MEQPTDKFIVVGDRVLIKPRSADNQTKTGLYLPPSVIESEKVRSGYILKTGPGYPIPAVVDSDEPWKGSNDTIRYIPLQAQVGDLAIFLQSNAFEVEYDGEQYLIVPQGAILLLVRDEGLFS